MDPNGKPNELTSAAPVVTPGENDGLEEIVNKAAEALIPDDEPATPAEEAAPQGEAGATDEPAEGESETPPEEPEKIEGVSPEAQAKINKRIAQLTAKAKSAEERAAELEAKLEEKKPAVDTTGLGVAPEYLSTDEAALIKRRNQLDEFSTWLIDHFDEGYEGGGTADNPSYTPQQIRRRYEEVTRERLKIGARAEAILAERRTQMEADLKEGRRLRMERERLKKTGKLAVKSTPAAPARAPGKPVLAPKARATFDTKKLMEEGPTPDALTRQFENALGL